MRGYRHGPAVGRTFNTASRIESLTKTAGACILISESVYGKVKDHFEFGKTIRTEIKG